jgi:predicted transcriptional regulator
MHNQVEQLVTNAQHRIDQITELLPQLRHTRDDANAQIKALIVERVQLDRMVRATQPRRRR